MVLTVTAGQALVLGVLLRRQVEIDLKTWSKQTSVTRKAVGASLALFYLACCLWAQFHTTKVGKVDGSTVAGLITGAAFAVGLLALVSRASKRAIKKRQLQDESE
jgi:hypothetical protein